MSPERRRGLVRLAILLGSAVGLVVIAHGVVSGSSGAGGEGGLSGRAKASGSAPPSKLTATMGRLRLPQALHGIAVAGSPRGPIVVGGEDSGGASSDRVYRLDPAGGQVVPDGTLAEPLHDAAASALSGRTLVFGGGNTSTLNLVQALQPGGQASRVGQLPAPLSDLSAVPLAGAVYVLGGYDGSTPSAAVYQTTDGHSFVRVAHLPTAIRYTALATIGDKIYAFGGELADGSETDEIQEYDIGTERAVVAGHLPQALSHASAVTLDGAIYLLGGRVNGSASDRIWRFDPARGAVAPAGRLPQPTFDGAAGLFQGRAYLIGGVGSGDQSLSSVIELR